MTTQIQLFAQPQQLPDFLKTSAVAQQLNAQVAGGLDGKQVNRISLRNGKFHLMKEGTKVGVIEKEVDVIIMQGNPHVGRVFYLKAFDPDDTGQRPDCYSITGDKPELDSQARQAETCALCPQNVKGSAKNGVGKACAYKKRVIVTHFTDPGGDAYALDVGSMSMFGEDEPNQRLFNFRSYIDALKANGLMVPAVVTKLSFDDEATVPKLFFTPVRTLTNAEWAVVESRVNDPAIREMLADVVNEAEVGKPLNQPAPALPSIPTAAAPAPVAPVAPVAQATAPAAPPVSTPTTRRNRRNAEAPPATAPAMTAPPPPPAQAGFPVGAAAPAVAPVAATGFPVAAAPVAAPAAATAGFPVGAPPAMAAPVAGAAPGFALDLDKFDE